MINSVIYDNVWLTSQENLQNIISIATRKNSDIEKAVEIADKNNQYYAFNGAENTTSNRVSIQQNVAVISITGSIVRYGNMFTDVSGAVSTESIKADLEKVLANQSITKIILSFDTGGGMVNGVSDLSDLIYANREKIVAHVKGMACSAGYWLASACSAIHCENTSILGNIGAIMGVYKKDENLVQFVSSQSPNKAPDVESKEGEKEYQNRVDAVAEVFIEAVSHHLDISNQDVVSRFGAGSVFVGQKAVDIGLANSVTSLSNLINQFQGGNMPKDNGVNGAIEEQPIVAPTKELTAKLEEQNEAIATLKAQIADKERVEAINTVVASHKDVFSAEEINQIVADKSQTEHTVAKTILEKISAKQDTAPIVTGAEVKVDLNAVGDAILMKSGITSLASSTLETKGLESKSMMQLLSMVNDVNLNTASQSDIIASMNTGNFPVLLSNVQNKLIADAYDSAPVTYREWTKSVGLKDFKTQTLIDVNSFDSDFEKLSEGGSLQYGYRSEDSLTWRLYSYGKKFALTYEAIVNDDLGGFFDNLMDLVSNIEAWKNRQVYDLLLGRGDYSSYKMADSKAIFDASHANTGTAGVVSQTTLLEGYKKMVSQTVKVGKNKTRSANIKPKNIIISPDKFPEVSTLLNTNGANGVNDNVVKNLVSPIADFELVGQNAWFMTGATRTIRTGYLQREGNRPVIEMVRQSKIHGIEYEIAFRFGIVAEDYRSLFKNAGA
jgi:ClpP class serine protease